jgi:hypothetical protein
VLLAAAILSLRTASAAATLEFIVTYSGQDSATWNWSDGSRDRITLSASGTVRIRPYQTSTKDGQSFVSYTADLETTNHVWGTAIEDGTVPTDNFTFDAVRSVSRHPSSTYSHFTPGGGYLYFETEDSVYAPPDDITVYAWEYVSSEQVLRMWVALPDPFSYDSQYEHYDFAASHVVGNASSAHSSLLGTVLDSLGAPVSGAQVTFGGIARTTDASGAFQYDDIPPGTYSLTISKAGLRSLSSVESIPAFSILHRTYTMGAAANLVITRIWSDQIPGSMANALPASGAIGAGSRATERGYLIMAVRSDGNAYLKASVSPGQNDPGVSGRIMLRVATDPDGSTMLDAQPVWDSSGTVASFSFPVYPFDALPLIQNKFWVVGWVDMDANSTFDPANGETLSSSLAAVLVTSEIRYNEALAELLSTDSKSEV